MTIPPGFAGGGPIAALMWELAVVRAQEFLPVQAGGRNQVRGPTVFSCACPIKHQRRSVLFLPNTCA
jgi:hypothetical protein